MNITSNIHPYPFSHLIQDQFLPSKLALQCQKEILNISPERWDRYNNPFEQKFTLRDKTNLPPNLHLLFQHFTSSTFVNHLSSILKTPLHNDPTRNWWGVHLYKDGDYLDIHCDAGIHPSTGQKKHCTLGLYLSHNWKEENGGHLELWEGSSIDEEEGSLKRCVKRILPSFNRLVIFTNEDHAWHGNPEPVKCPAGERRIFVTLSYLSEVSEGNRREKAQFIARPGDPVNPEKERWRELRADSKKFREVYNIDA